eukprot:TRINITY_DN9922_c0_g1_i4.p1 TRINITY_DN9922_c0_g1~~TRINITY_DN9922_c0_g1_i4.p1  ORF type:complete len:716 (-),score=235.19 TRINITY_DN9922_c0_g1_i4:230-2377(-)
MPRYVVELRKPFGIEFEPAMERLAVQRVISGSAAEVAGVITGSLLLGVNKLLGRSAQELKEMLVRHPTGVAATLMFDSAPTGTPHTPQHSERASTTLRRRPTIEQAAAAPRSTSLCRARPTGETDSPLAPLQSPVVDSNTGDTAAALPDGTAQAAARVAELECALQSKVAELIRAESALEAQTAECIQLSTRTEAAIQRSGELESELSATAETQSARIEASNATHERRQVELEQQAAQSAEQCRRTLDRAAQLQEQLTECVDTHACELAELRDEHKVECRALCAELAVAQSQAAECKSTAEQLGNALVQTKENGADTAGHLRGQLSEAQAALEAQQGALAEAEERHRVEIAGVNMQVTESEHNVQRLRARAAELQAALEQALEAAAAGKDRSDLDSELAQSRVRESHSEAKICELEAALESTNGRLSLLQQDLKQHTSTRAALEAALTSSEQQQAEACAALSELQRGAWAVMRCSGAARGTTALLEAIKTLVLNQTETAQRLTEAQAFFAAAEAQHTAERAELEKAARAARQEASAAEKAKAGEAFTHELQLRQEATELQHKLQQSVQRVGVLEGKLSEVKRAAEAELAVAVRSQQQADRMHARELSKLEAALKEAQAELRVKRSLARSAGTAREASRTARDAAPARCRESVASFVGSRPVLVSPRSPRRASAKEVDSKAGSRTAYKERVDTLMQRLTEQPNRAKQGRLVNRFAV